MTIEGPCPRTRDGGMALLCVVNYVILEGIEGSRLMGGNN